MTHSERHPCDCLPYVRGSLGEVVRETPYAVYRYRVCDTCGRVQGITRVTK
jgi:hypothetical protein